MPSFLVRSSHFGTLLAVVFLFVLLGDEPAWAQDDASPQLRLSLRPDSISFRLSGIAEAEDGPWLLQSSSDLKAWEDLAFFGKSAAPGADVELELANASMPQPGSTQQFFRVRYLEADDRLLREFLAARDLWRRSGINRYNMEMRWQPSMFTWHGTVAVSNHQVTSSETIFTDFFEAPGPRTLDDWFDQLKRFIDLPADTIIVTYDPVFGYPKSVSIDQSILIADEEESWSILEFLPGR